MRTTSQLFQDHLVNQRRDDAEALLLSQGAMATKAAWWLSVTGLGDRRWSEQLEAAGDLTEGQACTALLQLLAKDSAVAPGETQAFTAWLAGQIDRTTLQESHLLHHAAFHGRDDLLDTLGQLVANDQGEVDWNQDVPDMGTPMFMALHRGHAATVFALLRKTGGEGLTMRDLRNPEKQSFVLAQAMDKAGGARDLIEKIWQSAKSRFDLERVAADARGDRHEAVEDTSDHPKRPRVKF